MKRIAKRLQKFIDNHVEYYDDGGPESGPHVASYYDGPDWAIDLVNITVDPEWHRFSAAYDWEYFEQAESEREYYKSLFGLI